MRIRKRWLWFTGTLGVLIFLVYAIAFLIGEPLRRYMEREVNDRLTGYTVRITKLDFHPWGFSLDLKGLTVFQNANPDPPVARIPKLSASVQWRALLHRRVVADFKFDRPKAHINLGHFRKEVTDQVPLTERGWQKALEAISFDLKINRLNVADGDFTYVDEGQFKPLHITKLNFRAENIRNIRSKDRVYPSDIHLEGVVFDTGKLRVDGHADFLAEPHAGVSAEFKLEQVELDYFKPITSRYNVSVRKGVLSTGGNFEYSPKIKVVALEKVTVRGVRVEYVHTSRTAAAEKAVATRTVRAAKEVSNHPDIQLRIDRLHIENSHFGFVDKSGSPEYRVFLADAWLDLENLSNQRADGTAVARLRGKFMGTGDTVASATFRPETKGADVGLKVQIENTDMVGMNDLLRAYGNFDVVDGQFSLYSEFSVKNGAINGYVKPLFRNLDVYDARQDRDKKISRKMFEGLIGGIAKLLENIPRDEVATKATISGRVENPETSRWEIVRRLIQNAFFRAILPGFDKENQAKSREVRPKSSGSRLAS